MKSCDKCGGVGWYADHNPDDPHINGCSSCPIQVQCNDCEGTGASPPFHGIKSDIEGEVSK